MLEPLPIHDYYDCFMYILGFVLFGLQRFAQSGFGEIFLAICFVLCCLRLAFWLFEPPNV